MNKYALLRRRVAAAGLVAPDQLCVGPAATDQELLRAHDPDYLYRVKTGMLSKKEIRRIGFPWSPGLVERSRRSTGSTIAAGRAAFEEGLGVNLAGGTHHAGPDFGQGYCVFNDAAVAARALQAEGRRRAGGRPGLRRPPGQRHGRYLPGRSDRLHLFHPWGQKLPLPQSSRRPGRGPGR